MSHPDASPTAHHANTHAQRVIAASMDVYTVCRQSAAYCVDQGGDFADPHRIQVLYDCADSHLLAADFLGRASRFNRPALSLASEIAQACADALAAFEHDDPQLRKTYAVVAASKQALTGFVAGDEPAENDARDEALKETFPASDPPPTPTEV